MKICLKLIAFFISFASSRCSEPELPPCPTNIQFLPQNLPMHCRIPRDVKFPGPLGGQMIQLPPFYQTPPPDKLPDNIPMPLPSGLPGPMPMPMPMVPMPVPPSNPASKLPVIIMPFYSPDPSYKNTPHNHKGKRIVDIYRRPRPRPDLKPDTSSDYDTSSDTSSGSSSDGRGWWKSTRGFKRNGRRFNRRHRGKSRKHMRSKKALLTPVLQYVTKDGYVIYEKKISKDEAKDWLNVKKDIDENDPEEQEVEKNEFNFQEPVDEFLETDPVTETRAKNREELLEIITQGPMRKHHPQKMRIKSHHHTEPQKN